LAPHTVLEVARIGLIFAFFAVWWWFVSPILRNTRDRVFAALLLGFAGHYGGAVTLIIVAAGLVATRGRRAGTVVAVTVLAQLPWLVPGLIVYSEGASIVDSTPFAELSYDAVYLLKKAIEGAGATDPASLQKQFNQITAYPGLTGSLSFNEQQHTTLNADQLTMVKFDHAKNAWEPVQ
jgi:hypothetical protein